MGTYSTDTFLSTFGGMPDPGETYPADPDAVRDNLAQVCVCGCMDRRDPSTGQVELCPIAEAHLEDQA